MLLFPICSERRTAEEIKRIVCVKLKRGGAFDGCAVSFLFTESSWPVEGLPTGIRSIIFGFIRYEALILFLSHNPPMYRISLHL